MSQLTHPGPRRRTLLRAVGVGAGAGAAALVVTEADRAEIMALVTEYAWLVDHGFAGELESICTDEVRLTIRGRRFLGREGLAEYAAWREEKPGRRTHHQITNVRLRPAGPDHVLGVAGLVLHVAKTGSRGTYVDLVGEYVDEFVRTPSGWRIDRRTLVQLEDA
jgi:hypothetical protein